MNNQVTLKKILIAPLDWGLGHATRCIPLIKFLISQNCSVTVAASAGSKALLKAEFPGLHFFDLNSYNIVYSRNKRWMPFKILLQSAKILKAVNLEHEWLKQLLQKEHFDAVISDNRYGLYAEETFCVFITHQLQVRTTLNLAKNVLRKLTYKRINKFRECWVPDFAGELNIAGKLSHPETLPQIPVKFLGPLSRFTRKPILQKLYKYFFIISGPEPQRSIFEEKILSFVKHCKEKCLVILGKPLQEKLITENENYKIYNHLSTTELEDVFNTSEYIVGRSGYTSVMEILSLQKKSVLIPTPGQTEQEYLAKHLMKQSWCYTCSQHDDLKKVFLNAEQFKYNLPKINTTDFENILKDFVLALSTHE